MWLVTHHGHLIAEMLNKKSNCYIYSGVTVVSLCAVIQAVSETLSQEASGGSDWSPEERAGSEGHSAVDLLQCEPRHSATTRWDGDTAGLDGKRHLWCWHAGGRFSPPFKRGRRKEKRKPTIFIGQNPVSFESDVYPQEIMESMYNIYLMYMLLY